MVISIQPLDPLADPGAKLLAEGVVLHPDRTLSLQFRYRNRPQPWERRPVLEWASMLSLQGGDVTPGRQLAELIRRLKDPNGCWPATHLLGNYTKSCMYILERDGATVDGQHYSLGALLGRLDLTVYALAHRLASGWTLEQALSTKNQLAGIMGERPEIPADAKIDPASNVEDKRARLIEYGGVWATLKAHCERLDINYNTCLSRIQGRTYYIVDASGLRRIHRRVPPMSVAAALRAGRRKTRSDKGGKHAYRSTIAKRLDFGA